MLCLAAAPGLSTFKSESGWKGTGEQSIHPMLWRHPVTGSKSIMAHTLLMQCLRHAGAEMSWEQSQAAVAKFFEPVTQPDCILVHNWAPGDLVRSYTALLSRGCV